MAQNYLMKIKENQMDMNNLNMLEKQEKESYDKIFKAVSNSLMPSNIISSFLDEKAYTIDNVLFFSYLVEKH